MKPLPFEIKAVIEEYTAGTVRNSFIKDQVDCLRYARESMAIPINMPKQNKKLLLLQRRA